MLLEELVGELVEEFEELDGELDDESDDEDSCLRSNIIIFCFKIFYSLITVMSVFYNMLSQ